MILTESNFNRIKDEESYKLNFNHCQTVEEFNNYIKDTLEVENINILINNIIRIMNIINETNEDNSQLEIKELILKANLSENSENLKVVLKLLTSSSDKRIIKINKIFDDKLLDNLDDKINLLIQIEKLSEYFYPNFYDKLVMNKFSDKVKEEKNFIENKIDEQTINYSTLDIDTLCKELTFEQIQKLITCLIKKFGSKEIKNLLKGIK